MRISDWSSDVCSSDLVAAADRGDADTAAARSELADQRRDDPGSACAHRMADGDASAIAVGDPSYPLGAAFIAVAEQQRADQRRRSECLVDLDRIDLIDVDRKSTRLNSSH